MWDSRHLFAAAAAISFCAARVSAGVLYVDLNSSNPQPPYAAWATAATNIQDAVDAGSDGDLILVTNGFYQTGGRVVYGSLTNRVAVTRALTLKSVNGPDVTTICGNNQGYGPYNVRCVYLTNGAALCGFTLTNGATGVFSSDPEADGGGVWCESVTAVISNCIVTGSWAWRNGGGVYSGSLATCTLRGNSAGNGGGAASACLTNCVLPGNLARGSGGGAQNCTLSGCVMSNNFAANGGGGFGGYLENCILSSNLAQFYGGGASGGSLTNCIIIGNGATNAWPYPLGLGGGAWQATLNSCSVISNTAGQGGGVSSSSLTNCELSANSASAFGGGGGAYDSFLQGCTVSTNVALRGGGVAGGTLINCTLAGNSAHAAACCDISEGGGACGYCTLINCVLVGNQSTSHDGTGRGGGTAGCSLTNCVLSGNYASEGGGASESALTGCTLLNNERGWGAGAEDSTLNSCLVVSNRGYYGGGLLSCNVANSILVANSAYEGGGAAMSTLDNCTVVLNSAAYGGGVAGGAMNNCIIYSNTADDEDDGPNYGHAGLPEDQIILNYCCTTPMPTNGQGNITDDPSFQDLAHGDFRLAFNSLCINAGCNSYVNGNTDAGGGARVKGGTVDIGAFEFQTPMSVISYAWLKKYGIPNDGSVDYADADGDGMNNWQEWRCGTAPTDPLSVLRLSPPQAAIGSAGVALTWKSVPGRTYVVERSTNILTDAFSTVQSGIVAMPGATGFTDTNATGMGPYFYRVGVE